MPATKSQPKPLKRKMRNHRSSKKFNPQEYDKCRENLLNFLAEVQKAEDIRCPDLEELQKEYKVEAEDLPNNDDIVGIFETIYRRSLSIIIF